MLGVQREVRHSFPLSETVSGVGLYDRDLTSLVSCLWLICSTTKEGPGFQIWEAEEQLWAGQEAVTPMLRDPGSEVGQVGNVGTQ